MRPLDVQPLLDEVAPFPTTDLPAAMVRLALDEGEPSPSWAELREWLSDDRGCTSDEAEALILDGLRTEEAAPHLNADEMAWEVRVEPGAARAVLLHYALRRLDSAGIDDLYEPDQYVGDDRWLVLGMIRELAAIADGCPMPLRPDRYRELLSMTLMERNT